MLGLPRLAETLDEKQQTKKKGGRVGEMRVVLLPEVITDLPPRIPVGEESMAFLLISFSSLADSSTS